MKIIDVIQGSPEWSALRAKHHTASEAPAVMGASKYQTRSQLLNQKATGLRPEVDAATQARFDRGHETEAAARLIVEEMLGTDLYPITAIFEETDLLASVDGISEDDSTLFEHKLYSVELAEQVRAAALDPHYYWQLEQQLLVTGAERVVFVTSDGTRERFESMEYRPVPGRRDQLIAAWRQLDADLAVYIPPEPAERVTAQPVESLPAISARIEGSLAVHSNLDVFGAKLREFVARIPQRPSSEQEFADAEAACKALKKAEEALDAAEGQALGQVESVELLTRSIMDLRTVARTARLATEKLVKQRKEQIRIEECQRGRKALDAHIAHLNERIGGPYMSAIAADFGAAISGVKTIDSLRARVDQLLADKKIEASAIADDITINLRTMKSHGDYAALFPDLKTIVTKKPDDFQALVQSRVLAHQAEEKRRAEALAEKERERIRAEEQERAQQEAAEQNRMRMSEISGIEQQVIIATMGRAGVRKGGTIECIRETLAETEAWAITEATFGPLTASAQAVKDKSVAAIRGLLLQAEQRAQGPAPSPAPAPAVIASPALSSKPPAANSSVVVPINRGAPTLRIGEIGNRLGFGITEAFLRQLGFPAAAKQGAACLYYEAEFGAICDSLVAHIRTAQERQREAVAA